MKAARAAMAMLTALALCRPLAAWAAPFELDVEGHIDKTDDAAHSVYRISEAQLLALPAHSIVTSTVWTPKSTFTGPLLADVLKLAGAHGERVELRALDDYTVTVPIGDAEHYGAILAYSMNGRRLKVRDFGPLFLIYPRDAYPSELSGPAADARFVWQVKALILR